MAQNIHLKKRELVAYPKTAKEGFWKSFIGKKFHSKPPFFVPFPVISELVPYDQSVLPATGYCTSK